MIFAALAQGRLHLTAVGLLAPHLVEETAAELLGRGGGQDQARDRAAAGGAVPEVGPADLGGGDAGRRLKPAADEHAPAHVDDPQVVANSGVDGPQLAPERVAIRARVTPLSSRSYALQATIDPETQDYLRRAAGSCSGTRSLRGRRPGAEAGAQGAGHAAREAEVRRDRPAARLSAACQLKLRARSRPTSGARSGSGTRDSARSKASAGIAARHAPGSSSTMSTKSRAAERRRPQNLRLSMPRAQPAQRRAHVRSRVHAP